MTHSTPALRDALPGVRNRRSTRAIAVPRVSRRLFSFFGRYCNGYLRRHFHTFRVANAEFARTIPAGPAVIYLNHPSWWDPLACILLAQKLFPDRTHYAPIDGKMLARYGMFRRLGFFGVERGSRCGSLDFLETAGAILAQNDAVLWITAQGHFRDPRERPIRLAPGLAHLLRRHRPGVVLPLALEYPFWEERMPEALARFGAPLEEAGRRKTSDINALLQMRLSETMDQLALDSATRNTAAFEPVLAGRAGVGGMYDRWRQLRAWLGGQPFQAAHGDL